MSDPATRRVAESIADDTTAGQLTTIDPEGSDLPPLRTYNVFATFADAAAARQAIVDLERKGIDGREISALALQGEDADPRQTDLREADELDATGAHDGEVMAEHMSHVVKGAGIGAVAGALGTAAVVLAIPGVGAAIGAGIIGAAAGGAFAGTGVGGFAGAVTSTPAAKGWQHAVADLDNGRVVIGVHTTEANHHDEALSVLASAEPISIREIDADGEPV